MDLEIFFTPTPGLYLFCLSCSDTDRCFKYYNHLQSKLKTEPVSILALTAATGL